MCIMFSFSVCCFDNPVNHIKFTDFSGPRWTWVVSSHCFLMHCLGYVLSLSQYDTCVHVHGS